MKNSQQIFTENTILKSYKVWINDQELGEEAVGSLELSWGMSDIDVTGFMIFRDVIDSNKLNLIDTDSIAKIYAVDIYDEIFQRTFKIIKSTNIENNTRTKTYLITLQDPISYTLGNIYLGKSFNSNKADAINSFFSNTGIDSFISTDKITKNFNDTSEVQTFIVPQNKNFKDYLEDKLPYDGLRFWQDRKSLNLTKVDFNTLEKLKGPDGKDLLYTNKTINNFYGFKIFDFNKQQNNIINSNIFRPKELNYKFDFESKSMDTQTKNLVDVIDTMKINNSDRNLELTIGQKMTYQGYANTENQKIKIENLYLENNVVEIVVPGNFKYNNIGKICELSLKGNINSNETQLEGDFQESGKYIIKKIVDKFIGDKLIQKITLVRLDDQVKKG